MNSDRPPLILDFDHSVLPVTEGEVRVPLEEWQEKIRFGCSLGAFTQMGTALQQFLPLKYGCVFMGSGDYHHLTLHLLRNLADDLTIDQETGIDVVVCDNHPDNMRYPFGIHCGSWVRHACALPFVRHIHVIGITSPDISLKHAWENYWQPLRQGRLTYWSVGQEAPWLKWLGRGEQAKNFPSADALIEALLPQLFQSPQVYLSVDKDVCGPETIHTNWDQGVFELRHVEAVIKGCQGRLVGADITGEFSEYTYKSAFKRLLSGLDGQDDIVLAPHQIPHETDRQQELNRHLFTLLNNAWR